MLKNPTSTIDDAVRKPYLDALTKKTVDGAEILIAPEKPMYPVLPLSYTGAAMHTATDAQAKNSFKLTAGMGIPTIGKLGFDAAGGLGHTFGVYGQGNKANAIEFPDAAKNLLYPAQSTDETKCKASYLYVVVMGGADQKTDGSTLPLSFIAKEWDINPLVLLSEPENALKSMDRESAKFLAAGIATVAMVAASIY
jgi:hypothetical protein